MKKILLIALFLFILSAPSVFAQEPCTHDTNCDRSVDATDVDSFLSQFGRNQYNNPCPDCYDSQCPCTSTACPSGQIDCGGTCIDPLKDREYCGASGDCLGGNSGTICQDGEICTGGDCTLNCPNGLTNCSGTCVDTDTDEDYCGSCMNTCVIGEMCVVGSCEIGGTVVYRAAVEKTGQMTSYATGDDGDLEKGVPWPNPRFTDNSDGTVTDNLTGLIWLKNANCFGKGNWYDDLSAAYGLASGSCGLTDGSSAGDWRLPNRNELESLVHKGYSHPAVPNTAGTGQWSAGDPFTNVQSGGYYWSSTTDAYIDLVAWYVDMDGGGVYYFDKYNAYGAGFYVWPVRGGQ